MPRAVALRESPIVNYDERDMMEMLYGAGFGFVRLEYEAMITGRSVPQMDWNYVYSVPANPMMLSLEQAVKSALSEEQQRTFVEYGRNLVGTLTPPSRRAFSYLVGVKPMQS